jgi:hypothetical protein
MHIGQVTRMPMAYRIQEADDNMLSILWHQALAMPSVLSLSCLLPSLPLFPMFPSYL